MKCSRKLFFACIVVTDPLMLEPHEYVVLGKVKSQFGDEITIEPKKYFKGEPHQRLVVYSNPTDDSDCNPELEQGETYLIYGSRMQPPQRPYLAVSLALPEGDVDDLLAQLAPGRKPSISGSNLSPKFQTTRGQRASAGIVIGAAMALIALLFAVITLIYYFFVSRSRTKPRL